MNYRHIYHAGNSCDVVKHSALALVLTLLGQKEKPFAVLDTHAGVGLYDLQDPRALKTNEAEQGILKLIEGGMPAGADAYWGVLKALNPDWNGKGQANFRVYPGSPLLTLRLLRDQDRIIACELHPEDAIALRGCAPVDKRLHIHHRDGYEAMGALLPPPEKRGVAFIDPPFERVDEFETIVARVTDAFERWSNGTFMVWYPIKDRPAIWRFYEAVGQSPMPKVLAAEFLSENEAFANCLQGSGLLFINPPFKLDLELGRLFRSLHGALGASSVTDKIFWIKNA